mgnify:FL=1
MWGTVESTVQPECQSALAEAHIAHWRTMQRQFRRERPPRPRRKKKKAYRRQTRSLPHFDGLLGGKGRVRDDLLSELENEHNVELERDAFISSEYWDMLDKSERKRLKKNFNAERREANSRIVSLLQSYRPTYVNAGPQVAGGMGIGMFGLDTVSQQFQGSPLLNKPTGPRYKRTNRSTVRIKQSPAIHAKDGVLAYLKFEEEESGKYDISNQAQGGWTMDSVNIGTVIEEDIQEAESAPALMREYSFLQNEENVVGRYGSAEPSEADDRDMYPREDHIYDNRSQKRFNANKKKVIMNMHAYSHETFAPSPIKKRKKRKGIKISKKQHNYGLSPLKVPSPQRRWAPILKKKKQMRPALKVFPNHPFGSYPGFKNKLSGHRLSKFKYEPTKEWNFPRGYKQPWKKDATKEIPHPQPEPVTGHDFDYYGLKNDSSPLLTTSSKKIAVLPLMREKEHRGNEVEGRFILQRLKIEEEETMLEAYIRNGGKHLHEMEETEDAYDMAANVLSEAEKNKQRINDLREQLRLARDELEAVELAERALEDGKDGYLAREKPEAAD